MRLIGLAVVFTFSLTLAPLVAETQQAGKVWRIRYLSAAAPLAADETFRRALRELGYTEGQNITIASRIRSRHSVGRRWSNLQTSIVFPLCIQARGWSLSGACSPTGLAVCDSYRRAAVYVDKILKGAKPADLPGRTR
jgi:hypothetical protein